MLDLPPRCSRSDFVGYPIFFVFLPLSSAPARVPFGPPSLSSSFRTQLRPPLFVFDAPSCRLPLRGLFLYITKYSTIRYPLSAPSFLSIRTGKATSFGTQTKGVLFVFVWRAKARYNLSSNVANTLFPAPTMTCCGYSNASNGPPGPGHQRF